MSKIYISVPISGYDYRRQRAYADTVALALSKQGYKPVNPFDIYAGKNRTWAQHIGYDLMALADCDAVFFCAGWEHSCGCCIEHDFVTRCIAHNKKNYKIIYG